MCHALRVFQVDQFADRNSSNLPWISDRSVSSFAITTAPTVFMQSWWHLVFLIILRCFIARKKVSSQNLHFGLFRFKHLLLTPSDKFVTASSFAITTPPRVFIQTKCLSVFWTTLRFFIARKKSRWWKSILVFFQVWNLIQVDLKTRLVFHVRGLSEQVEELQATKNR